MNYYTKYVNININVHSGQQKRNPRRKKLNRVKNEQERGCLVHFLRLVAACWPGAQTARDNHL